MAKVLSPSDIKITNLNKKIEAAEAVHKALEHKMDGLLEDYIKDCIKRKDDGALSVLVDKMTKSYFGKLYIYQAIFEIREKKQKKKK